MVNSEMVAFLGSIDVLDKNNLKEMFNGDDCQMVDLEDSCLADDKKIENKNYDLDSDFSNSVSLYSKEVDKFDLLGDKEFIYTKDLMLKNEIGDILLDKELVKLLSISEEVIDLRKVFASITNSEAQNCIMDTLNSYYNNSTKSESRINKLIKYYLFEYNKLCSKVGVPSIDDLNDHFSKVSLYNIFNEYKDGDVLDITLVKEMVSKYIRYMNAREIMINHNQRLVFKVASRYIGVGIPFLDIIQEGNLGLMRAVDKFDYSFGYKFSTYAMWWIQQPIIRMISDSANLIHYPFHVIEKMNKIKRIQKQYYIQHNCNPGLLKLVELSGYSEEEVMELLYFINNENVFSLDAPLDEDEDLYLLSVISDPNAINPYDAVFRQQRHDKVLKYVEDVLGNNPRNLEIICKRFGLGYNDGVGMTLQAIGKEFNLTRESVRQIEAKSLKRLRCSSKGKDVRTLL